MYFTKHNILQILDYHMLLIWWSNILQRVLKGISEEMIVCLINGAEKAK